VIPNFLVQTGDPLSRTQRERASWGTGSPGYEVPGEPGLRHRAGMAGMARLGDASSSNRASHGSQFYVTLARLSDLDGKYTVFGEIIQGYDVLQELVEVPADANDNPLERVEILSARLASASAYIPEDRSTVERSQERLSDEEAAKRNPGFFGRLVRRYW
jgi:cyclophilin family peptidyl-prolyl cis-trans isomerase